ncbi:cell envelope biogenesis protein OmpA [Mixta gaviniae]|uniref:Cell envelope biogenesis protein OmpA n=1 Tax=Mixta gaviniae TaxID=665914 RepID=A0A1X1E057_9GAMM|nr:cell envelope biogenesis protein OmpA [Mixta gaviniae]AUX93578.1 cell envelope biogenesis protein OmpA [Mixta gaviniae]ORM82264.1 cell envelope biogenesis protein OmpA [Mixta gaviniae]
MKKVSLAALCLLCASSTFAQSYKGYGDIPGNAVGYATKVVEYKPGPNAKAPNNIGSQALGAPDYYTSANTLATLDGGYIILEFDPYALLPDGTNNAEVYVYEAETYESWDAYVSNDLTTWTKLSPSFKSLSSGQAGHGSVIGYDLDAYKAVAPTFKYMKIVDTAGTTGGSDIDAVVQTSGIYIGADKLIDTDSRNGKVYDLYQNTATGAIGVKIIDKQNHVTYIPFSTDSSLDAVALSLQGDFNCDDEKDINVLATRKSDSVQLNIIKQQDGTAIRTIDNATVK